MLASAPVSFFTTYSDLRYLKEILWADGCSSNKFCSTCYGQNLSKRHPRTPKTCTPGVIGTLLLPYAWSEEMRSFDSVSPSIFVTNLLYSYPIQGRWIVTYSRPLKIFILAPYLWHDITSGIIDGLIFTSLGDWFHFYILPPIASLNLVISVILDNIKTRAQQALPAWLVRRFVQSTWVDAGSLPFWSVVDLMLDFKILYPGLPAASFVK